MPFFTTAQVANLEKLDTPQALEQELAKSGFTSPCLIMTIKNVYSFTTLHQMSIEQKQ